MYSITFYYVDFWLLFVSICKTITHLQSGCEMLNKIYTCDGYDDAYRVGQKK